MGFTNTNNTDELLPMSLHSGYSLPIKKSFHYFDAAAACIIGFLF